MLWMFLEFRQIVFPRNSTKVEITQLKEKKKVCNAVEILFGK